MVELGAGTRPSGSGVLQEGRQVLPGAGRGSQQNLGARVAPGAAPTDSGGLCTARLFLVARVDKTAVQRK